MSLEDPRELDVELIKSLINKGLFSYKELASALCMSVDTFGDMLDDITRSLIDKAIVDNKAMLIDKMTDIAYEGNKSDEVKFAALKYLLAALHGMTERNSIDKAELALKQENQRFSQTLRAAQMATKWEDPDITDKFLENVRKITKEIYR